MNSIVFIDFYTYHWGILSSNSLLYPVQTSNTVPSSESNDHESNQIIVWKVDFCPDQEWPDDFCQTNGLIIITYANNVHAAIPTQTYWILM